MSERSATVFLDFDGTITLRDATDAILEAFADPAWLQIEDAWASGRIGSRECLAAQMALVTASRDEVDGLLDGIRVDPGLATLLDACAVHAVPVHIISDGFDYCIDRIIRRPELHLLPRLAHSRIVSSQLSPDDGHWRATFAPEPCAHGCATCKPLAMQRLSVAGATTVFVGDGMSDRYAAACAAVVFAKDRLAAFCETASIPYMPYGTLAEVAESLEQWLDAGLRMPAALSGKVFPPV